LPAGDTVLGWLSVGKTCPQSFTTEHFPMAKSLRRYGGAGHCKEKGEAGTGLPLFANALVRLPSEVVTQRKLHNAAWVGLGCDLAKCGRVDAGRRRIREVGVVKHVERLRAELDRVMVRPRQRELL